MATKKKADIEPGPMANQPKVQASLRKLAAQQASNWTGVPVAEIKRGKHPVAGVRRATTPKKGKSK